MYLHQYFELITSAIKRFALDYSFLFGIFAVLLTVLIWKYEINLFLPFSVFSTDGKKIPKRSFFAACSSLLCLYYMDFRYSIIIGLLVFLLIPLLREYWRLTKLYEEFPTYPLILYYIYCGILRKIPKHLPFTGFMFQNLARLAKKFQAEGMFLVWIPRPTLYIFSEEAVQIFSNEKSSINKSHLYHLMKQGLGDGLITSNGEKWKKNRKLLNPVFQVGALKHTMSIFNENAENLVKKLEEEISDSPIELLDDLKYCVGGIVCEYTLGLKMNNLENRDVIKEILLSIKTLASSYIYRAGQPWLHSNFMWNLAPFGRKCTQIYEYCRKFSRKIVSEIKESEDFRKISEKVNTDDGDQNPGTFAHILLKHHLVDPDFTMEYIQDELSTILAAGYDTSSHAILWSLFLLGHHPDMQEKAFEEVCSISEGVVQYEDLYKLKYLEHVIKETLRLYSPVPIYIRNIDKDVQCGKYKVPKGTDIAFFPYMLHRDPTVFPDPEKFNPDRFLDGKMENRPWAYTPFAEGIRNCIGKRFAMMQMKVVLAHVLRRFRIESFDRREDIDLCWEIVLAPVQHPRMRLSLR